MEQPRMHPYIYAGIDRVLQTSYIKHGTDKLTDFKYWIDIACDYYNVTIANFYSKNRKRTYVEARQMAVWMYLKYHTKKELPRMSYTQIGEVLGRDHATVIHCRKTFESLMFFNKQLRKDVEAIMKKTVSDYNTHEN